MEMEDSSSIDKPGDEDGDFQFHCAIFTTCLRNEERLLIHVSFTIW